MIGQLANKFIKSPYDIVSVGDIVTVWVMAVDMERRRVSLTMIAPGTERRQNERRPHHGQGQEQGGPPFRREQREDRPPRGPRPATGEQQGQQHNQQGDGHRRFDQRTQDQRGHGRQQSGGRFGGGTGRRMPPRHGSHEGASTQHPPEPPRPPIKRKDKPKPKLTEAALAGKAPLRTFGELKALFETKKPEDVQTGTPIPIAESAPAVSAPVEPKPVDTSISTE